MVVLSLENPENITVYLMQVKVKLSLGAGLMSIVLLSEGGHWTTLANVDYVEMATLMSARLLSFTELKIKCSYKGVFLSYKDKKIKSNPRKQGSMQSFYFSSTTCL